MIIQLLIMLLSLGVLYWGAEEALNSSEKIGRWFGLSPFAIGLLLVGLGTSLPEFFVSHLAVIRGHSEIALGNIIGSNIANLFLVLAIAGFIIPLSISGKEVKKQLFLHLSMTLILAGLLYFRDSIDLISVVIFALVFLVYIYFIMSGRDKNIGDEKIDDRPCKWIMLRLIIGFFMLYAGGELLVSSGSKIGSMMGVSEYLISVIFVAFGTSFPELVTSIVACVRKKDLNIIVGNIIGSNIFNVAFVLGSLGFYGVDLSSQYRVEMAFLIGASLFLIGVFYLNKKFSIFSSSIFLLSYFSIIYYWVF